MAYKPQSCTGCSLYGNGRGFMAEAEGSSTNGVLLLGEALGEEEARVGKPFQGRAGIALTKLLLRRGHRREDFLIDNAVRCRPPDNKLNHQAYEREALGRCAHFLDDTLSTHKGKIRAVVAMGEIPLQRILHLGKEEKITPWRGYASWSHRYGLWVVPTYHPAYIMRGNQNLSGVFLHDIELALDCAGGRYIPHSQKVWEDPLPHVVEGWVSAYERALAADPEGTWLAYDIETPYKAQEEDEGALEEDDPSYTIIRIGFSWKEGDAISFPWNPMMMPFIKRLLGSKGIKLVHNGRYDNPRIAANNVKIHGEIWDTMWAWHVINSDLPKGLAFIAPMLAKGQGRWKHLGKAEPAKYNGIDAEVTRRIATTLVGDLKTHGLWEVFHRHVVMLDVVLDAMTVRGIHTDHAARLALSTDLDSALTEKLAAIQEAVPLPSKRLRTYKGKAKGVTWVPGELPPSGYTVVLGDGVLKACNVCGLQNPKKPHFRVLKKTPNRCAGAGIESTPIKVERLARVETFVPSNVQMQTYLQAQGHAPRWTKGKGDRRITFDDMALKELIRAYPRDPLYPLVGDYREVEKLIATYVGRWIPHNPGAYTTHAMGELPFEEAMRVLAARAHGEWEGGPPTDDNGIVHTIFTHAPSTLRLSSRSPNMQNIPRGDEPGGYAERVKRIFIPPPDHAFFEADYKAIEAVLVGYEAMSAFYTRAAKLGVHDYLNSHILQRTGKVAKAADASASDADLKALFKDLKGRFPNERNVAKRIVHGSNYGMTPRRMADLYPEVFANAKAAAVLQDLYFDVFPDVRKWQNRAIEQADDTGFLRNPFGYLHRFYNVREWKKNLLGEWEASWGEEAKRVLAFGPQSTAAGIMKEALLALFYNEGLGDYLVLTVHDSILFAFPLDDYAALAAKAAEVMARPVPQLPLALWGKEGECLQIEVECKLGVGGTSWGELKEGRV